MPDNDIELNSLAKSQTLKLYIGKAFTGVTVEPDSQWPNMWRVRKGDQVSDMVNLTRAKDAAITWFTQDRSGGLKRTDAVHWRSR